jgi:hypothetical protein
MTSAIVSMAVSASMMAANPPAPQWDADYGRALLLAQTTQRPLLVVLDKPAVASQRNTQVSLIKDVTQAALLANYELCHVDVTTPYGAKVAQAFGAKQFPYVAITDKTVSAIVYRKAGPLSNADWITTLAAHKDGRNPQDCFT